MFEEHESSLKKSMENHLLTKEKKLSELKTLLSEKENVVQQHEITISDQAERLKEVEKNKIIQEDIIKDVKNKVELLTTQLEELKTQNNEVLVNHEKELEESEIMHNEQLDQKT